MFFSKIKKIFKPEKNKPICIGLNPKLPKNLEIPKPPQHPPETNKGFKS